MTLPLFPDIIAADRIEKECPKWKYQVMFSMLLNARALAICLNNNTLREYIFARIYFSRELTFANCILKIANFMKGIL